MEREDIEGLIHDLNNVFQTIGDSAEVLQADSKWAKLARTIHRSVERGKRLAQSLLISNWRRAAAETVVENAMQFARDYLECVRRTSILFKSRIDADFELTGDPSAWERVLGNLFLNAAEAGAKTVTVEASGSEIVVWDDGPGISKALLPRIFEPHVSTKSILAGLGLYVVRSIVQQNGGTVTAGNRPGAGAEFRIQLSSKTSATAS